MDGHRNLVKSFKRIIKEKFDDDEDSIDDISKLSISNIRVLVHLKFRPNDDTLPTTKKELLKHWENTKDRYSLVDDIEYLSLFGNTINEVIEELLYGEWEASGLVVDEESDGFEENNAPDDDIDSYIRYGITMV